MHMHLYFGIARTGNYSLSHFSGTRGMCPSEVLVYLISVP